MTIYAAPARRLAVLFIREGFKRTPVRGSVFDRALRFSAGCLGALTDSLVTDTLRKLQARVTSLVTSTESQQREVQRLCEELHEERKGGPFLGAMRGFLDDLGFAQVYWDSNRQALRDRVVGTVVVMDGAEKVLDWRKAL